MNNTFLVFYVTHPDEATAQRITQSLLEAHLIACANIFPVSGAYWWEGAIARENEWVSILKTTLALEQKLEAAISAMHPYEIPCIMRFEARANEAYARWVEEEVRG